MKLIDKVVSLFTTQTTVADQWLTGVFKDEIQGPGPKRQSGDFLKAYSTNPIFRRAEQQIAMGVASLEWKVFAQRKGGKGAFKGKAMTLRQAMQDGGEWARPIHVQSLQDKAARDRWFKQTKAAGELVEIEAHPILEALNFTNTFFTGRLTRQLITTYIDILGEAPLLKERGKGGQIVGLWPIPPHWVTRMATPQEPTFGISFGGGSDATPVPETEVLWMVDPDPFNPYLRASHWLMSWIHQKPSASIRGHSSSMEADLTSLWRLMASANGTSDDTAMDGMLSTEDSGEHSKHTSSTRPSRFTSWETVT
jgi:hypothetical protein